MWNSELVDKQEDDSFKLFCFPIGVKINYTVHYQVSILFDFFLLLLGGRGRYWILLHREPTGLENLSRTRFSELAYSFPKTGRATGLLLTVLMLPGWQRSLIGPGLPPRPSSSNWDDALLGLLLAFISCVCRESAPLPPTVHGKKRFSLPSPNASNRGNTSEERKAAVKWWSEPLCAKMVMNIQSMVPPGKSQLRELIPCHYKPPSTQ